MSDLRNKLIRLAHKQPALRPDLLPLLASDQRIARRIYIESIQDAAQGAKVLASLLHQIIIDLTPAIAEAVGKTFIHYVPSAVGRTLLDEWSDFVQAKGNTVLKIHPGGGPQSIQTVSRFILRKVIRPLLLKMPKPIYTEAGPSGQKADVRTIKEWLGYMNATYQHGGTWNWEEDQIIAKLEAEFFPWLANTVERRYEKLAMHIIQQNAGKIVSALLDITRKAITANEKQIETNWVKQEAALARTANRLEKQGRILERIKQWWAGPKVLGDKELLTVIAGVLKANAPEITATVQESVIAEDAKTVLNALKLVNTGALEQSIKSSMAPTVAGALDPIVPVKNLKELLQ